MSTTSIGFDIFARDRASATFDKLGKSVDSSRTKLQKFQRVGDLAGKALAGGLLIAGAAAVKMGNAAAQDEQAASKLANTLRNAAGATDEQVASTERWIAAQGKALGVTDDELRPAISRLAVATGDLGKAQGLASIAMDVSAGTGKSLQTVTEALVKAQNGSLGGLSRLGIATKKANGETKSLEEITRELAGTYKGAAANAAETTAGKQKRLQVTMSELGEQIGAKLIPAMTKLAEVGLKVVDWVSRNTTLVGVLVGTIGGLVAITWAVSAATKAWAAVSAVMSVAQGVKIALTGADTAAISANTVAMKAWAVVGKVVAAGQWALNAAMTANPIGLVVVAIAALIAVFVIAYKKSETFRKVVNAAFDGVKKAAGALVGFIKSVFPPLFAVMTLPYRLAGAAIARVWSGIKDGARSVVDFVRDIPGKLGDLAGRFAGAGKALIGAFVDGMKNAAGIISGIAGNVWSAVRSMLNGAIDRINSALEFKIDLPGPDLSINIPDIPHLANGGIVKARPGGTLAVIGEGGRDEAVVPLGRGGGLGGGGVTVIVNGALDPVAVGKQVEKVLAHVKRIGGGRALAFES